ncbi:N,N'-diacetylchitobiose transport system substrate-binding protein [Caldalkalibacillus uzonensis]|uniref:N,N'-diacetylchitobiose transport system substrate-binding protein n=1 Tax=Caldalkalibacillus uzonensis TaxID=353224 RepID=A0ABU0CUJ4_9BACI|nr:sugar ABC transporter substrate-binding protein [Caldalkalibacillus uzonensis]MDQ0340025.1 N,N'-diacetylchitobiose transport system substrate-binding protein [Caldalkalibacillus uzonensis]
MKKRYCYFGLSLLLVFVLLAAGCTSEQTGGDNSAPETNEGPADSDSSPDLEATLRVWIMETGSPEEAQAYFERINAQFNERYPNVQVDVQFIPWLSAHQNLITAIAGGNAPDVSELGTTWVPEFAAMGALLEMNAYINDWGLADGWVPALEEAGTYMENLYGIPWYAGLRQLIYNKDIFEQAGVEVPETYDELLAVSEAIMQNTDAYAFPAVGISQHFVLPMVWHFGGELAVLEEGDDNELRWVSKINEAEAVEAFKFYTDLYKAGYVPEGAVNWSVLDTRQAFAQGDLAMTIDVAPGINAMINENSEIADKIGVAPLPSKANNASFVGGSNLAVFKQSSHPELAAAYVNVLLQEDNIAEWAQLTGFFPGTLAGLDNPVFHEDEHLKVFADALVHGRSYPASPSWGQFEGDNLFVTAVQEIMLGNKTAQEALDEVAEAMNNAFEKE